MVKYLPGKFFSIRDFTCFSNVFNSIGGRKCPSGKCGKPSCHCFKGGAKHVAYNVTFTDKGQSRAVYVPKDLLTEVRTWIEEHRRLKRLLREINQLTLALIRGHVQHRKRRRGIS